MKSGVLESIKHDTISRVFLALRDGQTLKAAQGLRYLAWVEEAERVLVHCGPEIKTLLESDVPSDHESPEAEDKTSPPLARPY